jgi:hypothetical protein
MSRTTSLSEFAAAQPNPKGKCRICALPPKVLEQIRAAKGSVPATVVARWLRDAHQFEVSVTGEPIRRCWAQHQ